jgi:Fic family protein
LANLLAGRTLCDILLPISDITSLLRAFRRRLAQSVATARQMAAEAQVVLILDAIDHAAIAADATGTTSFAHVLLASLAIEPIDGVALVASCRTERRLEAVGDAEHRELEIPAFSANEARGLIAMRDPSATGAETGALHTRSGGNPRCLDTLLTYGRPYDPPSSPGAVTAPPAELLDELLKKRLDTARRAARDKGASDAEIDLLLTGLALLPPPAPLEELAAAHGISIAQVESFAADLAPLLERTAYGLMFRDEPTETLIRRISASDETGRDRIIATLLRRQSESSYAARALPALLTSLRHTDQLVALAFDERGPPGASKVSLRDIRLARITAALDLCAKVGRRDDLLRLLLEASIVAAGHERSDRFLYEFPDLAAVANDPEALRRLFSTKAGWPGGRHSALGVAQAFMGDTGEARRNARRAIDWHNWASQNARPSAFNPGKASTEWDDVGFAYVEILAGNDTRVAQFFADRGDAKAYEKFGALFDLLERQRCSARPPGDHVARRLRHCRLPSRALWAAALEYSDRDPEADRHLVRRLASASPKLETPDALPDASLTAVARALDLGMPAEAQAILYAAAIARPRLYDFTSYWAADRDSDIALLSAGLRAALSGEPANFAQPLTADRLFGWHAALFPTGRSGMNRITVGAWRTSEGDPMQVVSGPVGREHVHYEAPEAARLNAEMTRFLDWFKAATPDPVLKAGIAHFWFVTVHPFDDGNGRIARAIADLALARAEGTPQRFYSMSAQIRAERKVYYDLLESTQEGDLDITPWLLWFIACLDRAFDGAETILASVLRKARFWEALAGQSLNERQRKVVNRLLDGFDGKLINAKWAALAKTSPDTALRDINDLISRGILEKEPGGGRSTSYSLAVAR